jgi:hypothetical protein
MRHWRVIVDDVGKAIEGGLRVAVRRGLVTEENCRYWWGFWKKANGDVYDGSGIYGEKDVVYGRLVDGVAVPVAEGLFVEPVEEGLFAEWSEGENSDE